MQDIREDVMMGIVNVKNTVDESKIMQQSAFSALCDRVDLKADDRVIRQWVEEKVEDIF